MRLGSIVLTATLLVLVFGLMQMPGAAQAGAPAQQGSINNDDCAVCHEEVVKAFDRNPHATLEKSKQYSMKNSCEACHGPGAAHADGGGDKTKIVGFKGADSRAYSDKCLVCHRNNPALIAFNGSRHGKSGLACTECHGVHGGYAGTSLLKAGEVTLCLECHTTQRSDFSRPYHHRVKEGAMKCSDCHQPHTGLDRKQMRLSTVGEEPCGKCHSDKAGPFVFEHAPATIRDCQACHQPHGSVNSRMLVRPTVWTLCLECHTRSKSALAAQPPSIHDVRNPRYQNCTTCHVRIHGSNSSRLFLR